MGVDRNAVRELSLKQLHTFRAVAERGSFSAAAVDLELSQPAVSFQVQGLERAVGERLIDRHGRELALTEAGRVVHRYARRLVVIAEELVDELGTLGDTVAGPLVVGASTGLGEHVLPRLCGEFTTAYPDVVVSLRIEDTRTVCERIVDRSLELGIVGAVQTRRGLEFAPFALDEIVLVAAPDSPLARLDGPVPLARVLEERIVLMQEGAGIRSFLDAALATAGVSVADLTTMVCGLQESTKSAVEAGIGVTWISRFSLEKELRFGTLVEVPVADFAPVRDFVSVRAAGRTVSRPVAAFLAFCSDRLPHATPAPAA